MATPSALTCPAKREALFEICLAGSGLGLTAFLAAHEGLLASLWMGPASMNRVSALLEATGLVGPGVLAVAGLMLVHAVVAVRRVPLRFGEVQAYARQSMSFPHWGTVGWGFQLLTAVFVGVLASVHLGAAGWDLPVEAGKSAARVRELARSGFYDVLLFAAAIHACLGLERIATKWGLAGRAAARLVAWLAFAGFVISGFATLAAFLRLTRGA